MNSIEIRSKFIDFFKSKGHTFVPASPVVPTNDPTLLFTNAGMNQFKPYFLGTESPLYQRAVNSQPCIRVSGKHNDLEDVGFDTYHHTSFEMLGNWSFGDYYKKEAIVWAWELLTEVYQLPKANLVVTVYKDDDEAEALWRTETDIHPDHVVRCGKKDNFWEMGATGPCGPCSEIHLDLHPDQGLPIERDTHSDGLSDRYMELWNLVFIQNDRQANGQLNALPLSHVDTGAGLERLAAQLPGVSSNYDTDCFKRIIDQVAAELHLPYSPDEGGVPHRVISDHIRTVAFGIADNVRPSNDGRGYVLRRLIRRALRFASQAGKDTPFLYQLLPTLNDTFGGHYQHIHDRMDFIADLVKSEEEQFLKTVSSGLTLFNQLVSKIKSDDQSQVSGDIAFKLYDTYGFPLDLTQVLAKEHNLTVDESGYNKQLEIQRERSRQARQEVLNNGMDESIIANSTHCADVHAGVYIDHPGGGEARIPANNEQRFGIAQHHTGTHLLHEGLRQVLGQQIQQAGSLVDVNRLRFDFTYNKAISKDELNQIEFIVNQWVLENHPVKISEESLDAAKKRGAHAMFGEKYGELVRVVDIPNISIELCGGNHVLQTSDLQSIKVVSESAVAAGIRRIEALVGKDRIKDYESSIQERAFLEYQKRWDHLFEKSQGTTIKMPEKLIASASLLAIETQLDALFNVSKEIEKAHLKNQQSIASDLIQELLQTATPLKDGKGEAIFQVIDDQPIPVLRDLADRMMAKIGQGMIVLVAKSSPKGQAIAKVSSLDVSAKELINELTSITGGGGGGRDNMAQAGGISVEKVHAGLAHIHQKYVG
ncbi:MAG: alanine--tRNA ligase [Candidatus Margulisiibacteriota bacterium]